MLQSPPPEGDVEKLFRKEKRFHVKFEEACPKRTEPGFLTLGGLRIFNPPVYVANLQEPSAKIALSQSPFFHRLLINVFQVTSFHRTKLILILFLLQIIMLIFPQDPFHHPSHESWVTAVSQCLEEYGRSSFKLLGIMPCVPGKWGRGVFTPRTRPPCLHPHAGFYPRQLGEPIGPFSVLCVPAPHPPPLPHLSPCHGDFCPSLPMQL